ncbi:hypothetical protein BJB45_02530 [Halomonas huangheensis]|uniref:Uncharacterized protein n=1 Tax=Halomonas huangheensis TaxID=1178482 RepID=W1N3C7_9GAMM|nr:hypothetical protein BJB45_02530 [Halomonas huangheensis]
MAGAMYQRQKVLGIIRWKDQANVARCQTTLSVFDQAV